MACVYTTIVNIANNKAGVGSISGDYIKQVFTDTIDSLAVQKITDYVWKTTSYVDMTNTAILADVESIGAGYTVGTTHPLLLKYAVAYSKVKVAVTASQDYVTYDRNTFGLYFRPEWLWWAQIPFGFSGYNSGIKNVKAEFDRLQSINSQTLDTAVQPLYYAPTVLNGEFSFGYSSGTDQQKLAHFKALNAETQKQVCVMQALALYNRYYQPETKQIDYANSVIYTSIDATISKYSTSGSGFSEILALIKPSYKFGVVPTGAALSQLKQNMLWFFARQLDSNIDYSTNTSA